MVSGGIWSKAPCAGRLLTQRTALIISLIRRRALAPDQQNAPCDRLILVLFEDYPGSLRVTLMTNSGRDGGGCERSDNCRRKAGLEFF